MKAKTMKKTHLFSLTLVSMAVLAGCSTLPENTALDRARVDYSNAQANQQVATLAPLQLKDAGEALDRANAAQTAREDAEVVDSLAYVAKQKIALARETAQRKNADLAVSNASTERNAALLEARTSEADHANYQAAVAQQSVEQKTAELAAADAMTQQQKLALAEKTAEADQARQQAAGADARAAQDHASVAALQERLNELNAKQTARGMVITLGDVLFDSNQAKLKSGGARNVQKLAAFLNQYPRHKVLIEGFTDSVGGNGPNQALSEQRARAVGAALTDLNVGRERVATQGYGEAYAVASNNTAAGRQLNRRVEIVLSDENGNIAPR